MIDPRDPDASLVPLFRASTVKNEGRTALAGRPIYDDLEVVDIRKPGCRDYGTYPAHAWSPGFKTDPVTGEYRQVTYAERFQKQYLQFKAHSQQTKAGTPLSQASFLTEARRLELRAFNIYTVEALAAIDGQELKNLGPGGRELKNHAELYLKSADTGAQSTQMQAELEALKAKNLALEDDNKALLVKVKTNPATAFEEMTLDQLKEFIHINTGHAPVGNNSRRQLTRMAITARARQTEAA